MFYMFGGSLDIGSLYIALQSNLVKRKKADGQVTFQM